jgi:hypothetical protein
LSEANRGSERRSMAQRNRPARGAPRPAPFALSMKAGMMLAASEAAAA